MTNFQLKKLSDPQSFITACGLVLCLRLDFGLARVRAFSQSRKLKQISPAQEWIDIGKSLDEGAAIYNVLLHQQMSCVIVPQSTEH